MTTNAIPIIELFGPTIQGEGMLLGKSTHFLRTGGCGYRCTWCDSMHAVDPEQVKNNRTMMTVDQIISKLKKMPFAPWLTLTGGDPCIHERLEDLFHPLMIMSMRVNVETQGEFWPNWLQQCDIVTFSPKGPSSGMNTSIATFRDNLVKFRPRFGGAICVKVVVANSFDLAYALELKEAIEPGFAAPLYDQFTFQAVSPLNADLTSRLKQMYDTLEVDENERDMDITSVKRNTILDGYRLLVEELLTKNPNVLGARVTVTPQVHALIWPTEDKGR
jgi:7-carboxy-7-deazaguanine synthase